RWRQGGQRAEGRRHRPRHQRPGPIGETEGRNHRPRWNLGRRRHEGGARGGRSRDQQFRAVLAHEVASTEDNGTAEGPRFDPCEQGPYLAERARSGNDAAVDLCDPVGPPMPFRLLLYMRPPTTETRAGFTAEMVESGRGGFYLLGAEGRHTRGLVEVPLHEPGLLA